jgi:hypothetical protein
MNIGNIEKTMTLEDAEILNTLETLASVNAMLRFHRSQEEQSENAIMNYEIRRMDLLEQLNQMLESYEVVLQTRPKKVA